MLLRSTFVVINLLAVATLASAADDMSGMAMKAPATAPKGRAASPEIGESVRAMETMHKGMMAPYSGDPDADFVNHMLPHHQGAVAMAQIELKYGKDPEMRTLAQAVIGAQNAEIAQMKAWLAKRGK